MELIALNNGWMRANLRNKKSAANTALLQEGRTLITG
jgi:hypothetical protein